MAKFTKGTPRLPNAGRKKGTKNKTTEEIRTAFQKVLSMKTDELEADLASMSPFQQWMLLDKLSNKVLPNLSKSDDSVEHSGGINIIVKYESDNDNLIDNV